jgi:hypothetical protein
MVHATIPAEISITLDRARVPIQNPKIKIQNDPGARFGRRIAKF